MNTIELIKDAALHGGTVPNERIEEVRNLLDKMQEQLRLCGVGCSCADKETTNFEDWLKKHKFKQIENTYVYKKGRMSIDKKQLWKMYKMINIKA